MADVYRIFGSELSPYSVKVRSYFRYKRIPHEWIVRGRSSKRAASSSMVNPIALVSMS